MKHKINLVLRILLGLILLTFGLNKFFPFMPMPDMPEPAEELMGALMASGYIMPMIAVTEILTGVLLIFGLFVPLALVLLAPLSVNVILFHLFLAPAAILPALVVATLNLYLLFAYKKRYDPILRPR